MPTGFGPIRDGYVEINQVVLSDHVREFSLDTGVEELPDNTHGDNTSIVTAGLEDWTLNVTFLQDFAASEVDATLDSIGGVAHTAFDITVGADATTSVSSSNPRYSGKAILASYRPLGGPHGSNLEATAVFRPAGNLTRLTS